VSRTIPIALQPVVESGEATLAHGLKITRADGQVFAFTEHDRDCEIDSVTYVADHGFLKSAVVTSSQASVGNAELHTPRENGVIALADVMGRLWDNAKFELFKYNWQAPGDGVIAEISGNFGKITTKLGEFVIELRDLIQFMQQPVGKVSSKTCPVRLGSTGYGFCNLDLAPYTVTGTITHVTDNRVFRDANRVEPDDTFGDGEFTFDSGDCAGYRALVDAYAADGTFTLAIPMFSAVQVGDTYTAVWGCRKRFDEDCKTKFGNQLNFQGDPHRTGQNGATALT
jgi:uncharacterized phage protein (TIGR02218 family)